ncbi:MAG: lamin tail domain-containing protein, partial [Tissierellales bacterium]|nr:lamin tail domain-containing protein [Tissierellales bacterium]
NRMKKRIIFATLAISAVLMTAACGKVEEKKDMNLNEDIAVSQETHEAEKEKTNEDSSADIDIFEGYRKIEVDGGDLSGNRESKVVVDIGFGDREYYAFTNEYGQLVKVVAEKIVLQDDKKEKVLSTGRYYRDEAKVPGVESKTLDEGHIIADSLGGVSNAYNITPQNSTLNRHGNQAYMEKAIREAGGCTDFTAIISYPDTNTQIPSHYSYTYTLNGNVINDEFDNINSDDANKEINKAGKKENEKILIESQKKKSEEAAKSVESSDSDENKAVVDESKTPIVDIIKLDKKAEIIEIKNTTDSEINLKGWKIVSEKGNQSFVFKEYVLEAGNSVKIGDSNRNENIDLHWIDGKGVWNNTKSDPAILYDANGKVIDRYDN